MAHPPNHLTDADAIQRGILESGASVCTVGIWLNPARINLKVDGIATTNLHKIPGVIDAVGGVTVISPADLYDAN